jgi:choline dehydrogenase-like flavoprotein
VKRVLFDDKRAVGIEYQVGGKESELLSASASRLVVISAGAFCSPAILQRWVHSVVRSSMLVNSPWLY